MKLEVEGGLARKDPSPEDISHALSSLDGKGKSFAILERNQLTYIQAAGSATEGFSLEYQSGSLKEHYCCPNNLSLEEAIKIFQVYALNENGWQKLCDWEPASISTGSPAQKLVWLPVSIGVLGMVVGFLTSIKMIGEPTGTKLFVCFWILFAVSIFVIAKINNSRIHFEIPRLNFSSWTLWLIGFVFLCFLAVFFGSREHANKQLWVSVFLGSTSLIVATGTTDSLRSGKDYGRFFTLTRAKAPIQFWLSIIVGYAFALALMAWAILPWIKKWY